MAIGILKTRFDLFDDVKLILKNKSLVSGEITEMDDDYIILETDDGPARIWVSDIEDYEEGVWTKYMY